MTYEKEIPAYAMQPARAPKIVPGVPVYHTEHITVPTEKQRVVYQFEEDILVPDTKDDMVEILLMEADCDVTPTEKNLQPKTDDLLNFTGTITLQTLYRTNREDGFPVAVTSKVPYKYQWNLQCIAQAEGRFSCRITDLEYTIMNERKFRVKISLEFTGQLFEKKELPFFRSLEGDALETKRKEITLSGLAAVIKEQTSIDARIEPMDQKDPPTQILWQHYRVTENYRQVTTEKIVLNGFVYVDLLYVGKTEEAEEALCHKTERIEFTQFIPLGKAHREKQWSLVQTAFQNQGLNTWIEHTEDGNTCFRMGGSLQSSVSLYEEKRKEMVVDAYHLEKDFICRFQTQRQRNIEFATSTEMNLRELISLPEGSKAKEVLCCRCYPLHWKVQQEQNRMVLTGSLQAISLWKDDLGYHTLKSCHDFQQSIEAEGLHPDMHVDAELYVRECHLTFINERQMELSCSLLLAGEGYSEKELILLEEPAFTEGGQIHRSKMVIASVEPEDSLWSLAKRHKTTCQRIRDVNHLEGEPHKDQKLLILK